MNDTITVIGNLATPPEVKRLPDGTSVTSFRLASNRRKFDSGAGRFVDVDANYYTVSVYREFGDHVARSLQKGDRIVVAGRLRLRSWQTEHGWRTVPELDVDAIGPDLRFGTTTFVPMEHPRRDADRPGSPGEDVATRGDGGARESSNPSEQMSEAAPGDWGAPSRVGADPTPF